MFGIHFDLICLKMDLSTWLSTAQARYQCPICKTPSFITGAETFWNHVENSHQMDQQFFVRMSQTMFQRDYCVNKTMHHCLMCQKEVVFDVYYLERHLKEEHEGIAMVGYFREFVLKEWKRRNQEGVNGKNLGPDCRNGSLNGSLNGSQNGGQNGIQNCSQNGNQNGGQNGNQNGNKNGAQNGQDLGQSGQNTFRRNSNSGLMKENLKQNGANVPNSVPRVPKLDPVLYSEITNKCVFHCKYCNLETKTTLEMLNHGKIHFPKNHVLKGFLEQVKTEIIEIKGKWVPWGLNIFHVFAKN